METYAILRRGGWRTPDELQHAAVRSTAEGDRTPDDIRWLRSYVLAETDGSLGTVCIYQASSPDAIRSHAYRAGLPVDEIVAIADTVIVRADPAAVADPQWASGPPKTPTGQTDPVNRPLMRGREK